MSAFTDNVVNKCVAERGAFLNEVAKEWWSPQYRRIGDYWAALDIVRNGRTGVKFKRDVNGNMILDANGQPIPENIQNNGNPPWSAAFISFVARDAGAGDKFHYSGYHSAYILKALEAAKSNDQNAPWIARRAVSYKPKAGDLIAFGRTYATNAEFDDAETYIDTAIAPDFFPSHTDFVVEINAQRLVTIGGNVSHTVKRKRWPLSATGHLNLSANSSPASKIICIMECRI